MALAESAALEHAMGELLSVMRGSASGPEQIQAAWARCEAAGAALNGVVERAADRTEEERAELPQALEQLLRLNAVVRQTVVEGQQSLSRNLDRTREASAQLRGYAPGASRSSHPGSSCDLAG